jgi:hypothetical protein
MLVLVLKLSLSVNGTAKDVPENLKLDNKKMTEKENNSKRLENFQTQ